MPLLDEDEATPRGLNTVLSPDSTYSPEFWNELLPAVYRTEHTFGSLRARFEGSGDLGAPDPNHDGASFIPEDELDQEVINAYTATDNMAELRHLEARLARERKDRTVIAAGGALAIPANLLVGVVDPINFIPVGGTALKTYRTGDSILRSAGVTAWAGFVSSSAQEAILHTQQLERTGVESAVNVGASTVFSAVLGGGGKAVMNTLSGAPGGRTMVDIQAHMEHDLTVNEGGGSASAARVRDLDNAARQKISDEIDRMVLEGKLDNADVNKETAIKVAQELLKQEGLKTNWAVDAALKVVGRQDPGMRMLTSSNIETRALAPELYETGLTLARNALDRKTPLSAEAMANDWQANLYRALDFQDKAHLEYVTGRSKRIHGERFLVTAQQALSRNNQKMTKPEFKIAVGKAMIRNDLADDLPDVPADAIPFINKVAAKYRSEIIDPMTKKAIDLGMLDPDVSVDTAASYFMRVYDIDKLTRSVENRAQFLTTTRDWLIGRQSEAITRAGRFKGEVDDLNASLRIMRKNIAKTSKAVTKGATQADTDKAVRAATSDLRKELRELKKNRERRKKLNARDTKDANLLDGDFTDIAEQILGRIVGTPAGRMPYDIAPQKIDGGKGQASGLATPFHKRVFMIDDILIEHVLVQDVEQIMKMYVRSMAPDLAMVEKFGDLDMTKQIKTVQDEYTRMKAGVTNDKELQKLTKAEERDIKDIVVVRDRIRNTHGLPDDPSGWENRLGRGALQFNYITKLGGMTASAIPDMARPTMVHGLVRVIGNGLFPLIKSFSSFGKLTEEMRSMGIATDMLTNSRMNKIADVASDDFARGNRLEKALTGASSTFGMVSLMAPWNTMFKQFTAVVSMARITKNIADEAAGKISAKEAEFLRASGISTSDGKRIAAQIAKHGQEEGGLTLPRVQEWDTPAPGQTDVARIFRAALRRDADRIIVTPGAADLPIAATRNQTRKVLFQFKSFALAATSRILMSGLQQADMAAMNGMVLSVFLGMAATAFKNWDAGRGEQMNEWTLTKWMVEGVDRSGLTGSIFEVNNMLEKATRGTLGFSAFTGGLQSSRYASRNIIGALLGPSFGTASTLAAVVGNTTAAAFGDDTIRPADTHAVRKIFPYQNLLLVRQGFDAAEEGINNALGIR